MEILFLYRRLFLTAQKQLESLRRLNLGELERLTRYRETVTQEISQQLFAIRRTGVLPPFSPSVKRKIQEMTHETLVLDSQIKNLLLHELETRTQDVEPKP